jgi:hypothetical protein
MRELILRFRSHRLRPMSDASDEERATPFYVLSVLVEARLARRATHKLRRVKSEFVIVADGRETPLHRLCYRCRMEVRRKR